MIFSSAVIMPTSELAVSRQACEGKARAPPEPTGNWGKPPPVPPLPVGFPVPPLQVGFPAPPLPVGVPAPPLPVGRGVPPLPVGLAAPPLPDGLLEPPLPGTAPPLPDAAPPLPFGCEPPCVQAAASASAAATAGYHEQARIADAEGELGRMAGHMSTQRAGHALREAGT